MPVKILESGTIISTGPSGSVYALNAANSATQAANSATSAASSSAASGTASGRLIVGSFAELTGNKFTYGTPGVGEEQVAEGDIITWAGPYHAYEVLASGAADEDLTTAGGVKLRVLSGENGLKPVLAFGVTADGSTDDATPLGLAFASLSSGEGLDFGDAYCATSTAFALSGLSHITITASGGGGMYRTSAGTAAECLSVRDCSDVTIEGMRLESQYKAGVSGSTGSNAIIKFGSGVGETNERCTVRNCTMNGGNLACVWIDGRDETDHTLFTNRGISVEGNILRGAGVGVFAYKGTKNLRITDNTITDCSGAGIVLDTQAAGSDDNPNAYRMENTTISGNVIENIRAVGVFEPRGIIAKGGIFSTSITGNVIDRVGSPNNEPAYGILITRDDQSVSCVDVTITGNTVRNIANDTGSAGWPMSVGPSIVGITVTGNSFGSSQRGIIWDCSATGVVTGNVFISTASVAEFPINVTQSGDFTGRLYISGNTFERSAGTTTAVSISASAQNVHVGKNELIGYTDTLFIGSGASNITTDEYEVAQVSLAVNVTVVSGGGISALQTVSAPGVLATDWVMWRFNPVADIRYVNIFATARADNIDLYVVNNSAASRTINGTFVFTVLRSVRT